MIRSSLALIAVLTAASVARAQPAASAEADADYKEGRRLYDLRDWDAAIAKFKDAYKLRADAPSLFNIAQANRQKGDCPEALGFYKTYKRNFPKATNLGLVDKLIADMEACVKAAPEKPEPVDTRPEPVDTRPEPVDTRPDEPPVVTAPTSPTPSDPGHGKRLAGYVVGGVGVAALGVERVPRAARAQPRERRRARRAGLGVGSLDPDPRPVGGEQRQARRDRRWRPRAHRDGALPPRPTGLRGGGPRRRDPAAPRSLAGMVIRALSVTLAGVLGAGCYRPSVDPCVYRCDNGGGCPNDLACTADHWCATDRQMSCPEVGDGGGCAWSDVSNIDPCANQFDTMTVDWTIAASQPVTIDTMAGTIDNGIPNSGFPAGAFMGPLDQSDGNTPAFVIAVGNLTVGAPITITGPLPVIFVVNGTAQINDDVIYLANSGIDEQGAASECTGGDGSGSDAANADGTGTGAGGGGGGGYATPGGAGGKGGAQNSATAMADGGPAGQPRMSLTLHPLLGGCRGGAGGATINPITVGGAGGGGGGAIQISARTGVRVTNATIQANGGGGAAPGDIPAGAGGGGAGGGILLEGPSVVLDSSRVCAIGGGGGGSVMADGESPTGCLTSGAGGHEMMTGGLDDGGRGGTGTAPAFSPQDGAAGVSSTSNPFHGGGGGGGAAGVIRLRGTVTKPVGAVVPPET